MKQTSNNPPRNQLPASVNEAEFVRAIETSGYPLQGIVINELQNAFHVTEEWSYIDRDTQELRSLDIFAFKQLVQDSSLAVQPCISLLIECKRSRHPYVFFRSLAARSIPKFPSIAGLFGGHIAIHGKAQNATTLASGARVLGLDILPFIEPGPPKCAAFSRAILDGKKIDLSGNDPFNSIVLPLVKALDHAQQQYKVTEGYSKLYPTLLLCLCVVDAPMVLVDSPDEILEPILTPWVRIVRQEAVSDRRSAERVRYCATDVVQSDYFSHFVQYELLPFSEAFSSRAVQLKEILFRGGTVANLDNWTWNDLRNVCE